VLNLIQAPRSNLVSGEAKTGLFRRFARRNAASAQNKTSRQFQGFPENRLLVEDLTTVGYPRPAPLLAASDHVFFEDRTAQAAKRSTFINLFPGSR
jgi:hypothetical protein